MIADPLNAGIVSLIENNAKARICTPHYKRTIHGTIRPTDDPLDGYQASSDYGPDEVPTAPSCPDWTERMDRSCTNPLHKEQVK